MKYAKYLSVARTWAARAIALTIPFVVSCSAGGGSEGSANDEVMTSTSSALTGKVVPGRYIVVLKKGVAQPGITGQAVPDVASAMEAQYGGTVIRTYQYALEGFALDLPAASLAAVKADSRVAYVEPDLIGSIVDTQVNPTWGLDRIDQRPLPLNMTYNYPGQAGAGVHAYVIDTGIYAAHPDFGSRVIPGVDFIDNDANPDDCHGHGTHVAGTIGSATWGVAKKTTLHSIRVCDCFGFCPLSQIIAGIDFVTNNRILPAVANLSLHTGFSQAENDAVTNSIAAGVTYGIAAANDAADACFDSPGSTPNALTVGATDIADARAEFSNYGPCLDLFGPGVNITSTWIPPLTSATISGTSMASPHVVGAAALYLGANPTATPAQVGAQLIAQATMNVVTNPGAGSPNRLLYMGFLNAPTGGPCDGLCTNPTNFTISGSYQSGQLGTGTVCRQTTSVVHGGNCGNFQSPRTMRVNGVVEPCTNTNWASIPPPRNGGYCFQATAGQYPWAYFTAW
jgi:subtilisin family serine protease